MTLKNYWTYDAILRLSGKHALWTLDMMMTRHPGPHIKPLDGVSRSLTILFLMQQDEFFLRTHGKSLDLALCSAKCRRSVAQANYQDAVSLANASLCPGSVTRVALVQRDPMLIFLLGEPRCQSVLVHGLHNRSSQSLFKELYGFY